MRILYLDDSGKASPNHPSQWVVYAGFAVDEARWHALVRQIAGAKSRFFAKRGTPNDWELKSRDFLKPNPCKRARNRRFCLEVASILARNDCTVYAAYLHKAAAPLPLGEDSAACLCFQALCAKFASELAHLGSRGTVACDWSSYRLDHHVSNCVQKHLLRHGLTDVIGGVTYGSSMSLAPLQVCDLLAGAFRMYLEGGIRLASLMQAFRKLLSDPTGRHVAGDPCRSEVRVF